MNLFHSRNLNIFLFDLCIFGDDQSLILSFSLLVRLHRHCNLLCNLLQRSYLLILVGKVTVFLLQFQQQLCTVVNNRNAIWCDLLIWLLILQRCSSCRTIDLLQNCFTRYNTYWHMMCLSYPIIRLSGLKTYFVNKRVLFVWLCLLALKLHNDFMLLTVFHVKVMILRFVLSVFIL